jgi:molecular chaperone GrpE (heat shock protein)
LNDKQLASTDKQKQTLNKFEVGDVSFSSSGGSSRKASSAGGRQDSSSQPNMKQGSSAAKSRSGVPTNAAEVIQALETQRFELQNTIIDMQTQIHDLSQSLKRYENDGENRQKGGKDGPANLQRTSPASERTPEPALEMLDKIDTQKQRIEQLEHRNNHIKQVRHMVTLLSWSLERILSSANGAPRRH